MIIYCKICGKPVEVKSPNVKYCDECRKKKYETAYRIRGEEEAVKYAYQKRVEQMRAKRNGPSISTASHCSFGIFTIGGLVTNDYCIIKCKKNPEDCIFRQPADKYVERRIEKDETR